MAVLSEKDLEQRRDKNAKLREQIAEAQAKASTAAQDQAREIEAAHLDAETARLEAQLAAAREVAKASVVKEASAAPIEAAKAQLAAAKEGVTLPGQTVDTNKSASEKSDADEKKE